MIKVCHITSVHRSDDTRVFHKECVSLAQAGYDVTLIAPGESREDNGVHVIGMGEKPKSTLKRLFSGMPRKVCSRAVAEKADVYHLHDPELLPYALKLRRRGSAVIFDSHEFYERIMLEKSFLPKFARMPIARLYHVYETAVIRRIDAVVTPCTLKGKNVFENRAKRTVFVDNLPRLDHFAPAKVPVQAEDNTVGYVGGVTYQRGAETMIRAAFLAGAKLRLAGAAWSAYQPVLEALDEYTCTESLGPIPYCTVPDFCRTLHVGLSLLLKVGQYALLDNLPTKVYEYLGCGVPVILSDTDAAKKFTAKYDCGMCVDPEKPEEAAKAIRYLLDHPEEARRMGENGRRAVWEEYNWATEEKKLLALYAELT